MAEVDGPLDALIDTYCLGWSDPDPVRRREFLGAALAAGATYTDPTVHAVGVEELAAHIDGVFAQQPGMRVMRVSRIDAHHEMARFGWRLVQADGTALPDGVDFVEVSAEGRIRRIVGFFGGLRSI
ncbi:nuclear transport factor 2 family protein [Nocardia sp. CS682]|uniref:nuclear transport factor 2 family protein n=1 Tax=Nocardia sp. CS682 TaxID=1047172 RepID=UPI001074F1A2|nr:nuclear transport factor 2 family protein [Nocardia sp. CS682]QBS44798.1 nuclear transport factor 2 family protein [Nocardia sp. CS682]